MFKKIDLVPRWIIFVIDLTICAFSLILSYFLVHNLLLSSVNLYELGKKVSILLLINTIVFFNFRTYAGIIRYTGLQDAMRIGAAICVSNFVLFMIGVLSSEASGTFFSNAILIINVLFSFLFLISYRVTVKYLFSYLRSYKMNRKNVIIYGAGEAGFATKRVLEHDPKSNVSVVAFLDDDVKKVGKVVDGVKIYHNTTFGLEKLHELHRIEEIIIASFNLTSDKKNVLVDFCLDHGIKVLNVPPFDTWINGEFSTRQLQTVKIENLLEREPIRINNYEIGSQVENKRILVTGAAGSIGSELVRQLLRFNPQTIILCDQAETPLHALELELQDMKISTTCISYLADITNKQRVEELFEQFEPHYVYHAAAYKHVPMMELCPSEAVLTNVLGTKIVADLSVKHHVQRFVMVSTDKAVNPTNVMGASKRLAEAYVQSLYHSAAYTENHERFTKFITTRFGNVLGSNGSVINRFKEQIEKGGPVTVTHPNITRFFMTIPEACQLVLEAGSMGKGGEIFVFDMGKPVAIADLAKKMIKLYGFIPDLDIPIKYTGLRPGEKLYEELLNDSENTLPTYHQKIMIAKVRQTSSPEAVERGFTELIQLAKERKSSMKIVAKMKELVPEFVSNNSIFEKLDEKDNDKKVVSLTIAI